MKKIIILLVAIIGLLFITLVGFVAGNYLYQTFQISKRENQLNELKKEINETQKDLDEIDKKFKLPINETYDPTLEIKEELDQTIPKLHEEKKSPGLPALTSFDSKNSYQVIMDHKVLMSYTMEGLLSEFRALPAFSNGQQIGLRLNSINPNSILNQAQLKKGDIVHYIEDHFVTVSNIEPFIAVSKKIQSKKPFSIKITRENIPTTIEIIPQ